jgi:zinc D-Ala-D-Ala carboxypeptidase
MLSVREPCGLCFGAGHVLDRQLSEHFRLSELVHSDTATRLGLPNEPGPELAQDLVELADTLEQVRALLGVPLRVTSAFRAPAVNAAVGSSDKGAHPRARAADFFPVGMAVAAAIQRIVASSIPFDQLIAEGWIHLGTRHPVTGARRREVFALLPGAAGKRIVSAFDAADPRLQVIG